MNSPWQGISGVFNRFQGAISRRKSGGSRIGRVEDLESRLLLTSIYDGDWQWSPKNPITPAPDQPPPYFFSINLEGISIIEAPDFGGLPITLKLKTVKSKANGDTIVGKGKSDGTKVKVEFNPDNRTPNDSPPDEMEGDIKFRGKNISKALRDIAVILQRAE